MSGAGNCREVCGIFRGCEGEMAVGRRGAGSIAGSDSVPSLSARSCVCRDSARVVFTHWITLS